MFGDADKLAWDLCNPDVASAYLMHANGTFVSDGLGASLTDAALRALATGASQVVTYTCLPPGRDVLALDRDGDGVPNGVDTCPDDASCH